VVRDKGSSLTSGEKGSALRGKKRRLAGSTGLDPPGGDSRQPRKGKKKKIDTVIAQQEKGRRIERRARGIEPPNNITCQKLPAL